MSMIGKADRYDKPMQASMTNPMQVPPQSLNSGLIDVAIMSGSLALRLETLRDRLNGSGMNASGPDAPPPPLVQVPGMLHRQLESAHKTLSEIEQIIFG